VNDDLSGQPVEFVYAPAQVLAEAQSNGGEAGANAVQGATFNASGAVILPVANAPRPPRPIAAVTKTVIASKRRRLLRRIGGHATCRA
jgi:hypothetical protein